MSKKQRSNAEHTESSKPLPNHPAADPFVPSVHGLAPVLTLLAIGAAIHYDLVHLHSLYQMLRSHGLRILLALVGTLLTVSDIVGRQRQRHIDQYIAQTAAEVRTAPRYVSRRVRAYLLSYVHDRIRYMGDVSMSIAGVTMLVIAMGVKADQRQYFANYMFCMLLAHAGYKLLVIDIRDPNDPITTNAERVAAHAFLLVMTLPVQVFRVLASVTLSVLLFPIDAVSSVAHKLNLEGYLKIIGALMILASLALELL